MAKPKEKEKMFFPLIYKQECKKYQYENDFVIGSKKSYHNCDWIYGRPYITKRKTCARRYKGKLILDKKE